MNARKQDQRLLRDFDAVLWFVPLVSLEKVSR